MWSPIDFGRGGRAVDCTGLENRDRKSTRLNSSHTVNSYAVFCLKKKAAELAPALPAAHVNLGAVYLEKKDYANAIQPLRKALELNPDLPGAQGMLGAALLALGYAGVAEREFRAETQRFPGSATAAYKLGSVLLQRGQVREAIAELQRSNALLPDMPETLLELFFF